MCEKAEAEIIRNQAEQLAMDQFAVDEDARDEFQVEEGIEAIRAEEQNPFNPEIEAEELQNQIAQNEEEQIAIDSACQRNPFNNP